MKVLKRSDRRVPRLSVVLLDWSVRESFHLLHYLRRQTVARDEFEVVVIEYYARESAAIKRFERDVDTWLLLEMPASCYYHKHLMYNAGIVLSRAPIVLFCDSDAMVRETFTASVLGRFEQDPDIVLHVDQFRNVRRDLYPFNYPSFEEVLGDGCINNTGGRTSGVVDTVDPLHNRNYGACMAARRTDLIAIGGADEHLDYLGHICGPYEMTFRLVNYGRREVWHQAEFLYHTWHPGQAGAGNYLGPHDGRHMSTTALEALATHRVRPYVENAAIKLLRTGADHEWHALEPHVIAPTLRYAWAIPSGASQPFGRLLQSVAKVTDYRGFRIRQEQDRYVAHLIIEEGASVAGGHAYSVVLEGDSLDAVKQRVDRAIGHIVRLAGGVGSLYVLGWHGLTAAGVMGRRARVKLARLPGRLAVLVTGVIRRSRDRLRRFFMERSVLSGSLVSLLVSLYHLRRQRQGATEAGPIPVILEARALGYYVRALSGLGVLPPVEVVSPENGERLAAYVAALSRNGGNGRVIVGRGAYIRHHAVFAASGLGGRIAVV